MPHTNKECFGSHSLPKLLDRLARFCQTLPANWLGKRISFLLRKPVLWRNQEVIDISVTGINFRLYPKTNLSDKRLLCTPNLLNGKERAFLEREIPPDATVVDVGANIGGYSLLLAAKIPNARYLCIEPDPEMYHRLEQNVQFNHTLKGFILSNVALTETDGKVTLYITDTNRGQNSLIPPNDLDAHNTIDVNGATLYNLLKQYDISRPDLLKLDIEGIELPVLRGFFNEAPESYWPDFIQLEQHKREGHLKAARLAIEKGYNLRLRTRMNLLFSR